MKERSGIGDGSGWAEVRRGEKVRGFRGLGWFTWVQPPNPERTSAGGKEPNTRGRGGGFPLEDFAGRGGRGGGGVGY